MFCTMNLLFIGVPVHTCEHMVFVYFPHLLNHWALQPLVRDSIRCSSQSSHRISYSFPLSPQATWNCHPGGPPPHTGSHHNTARVVHHLEATLRGKKWDAWVTLKKGASFTSLGTWRGEPLRQCLASQAAWSSFWLLLGTLWPLTFVVLGCS